MLTTQPIAPLAVLSTVKKDTVGPLTVNEIFIMVHDSHWSSGSEVHEIQLLSMQSRFLISRDAHRNLKFN